MLVAVARDRAAVRARRSRRQRWVRIIDFAMLYVMLALGLNIVVGFAGLLDLGYIAFYAVGAYVTGAARVAAVRDAVRIVINAPASPGGLAHRRHCRVIVPLARRSRRCSACCSARRR